MGAGRWGSGGGEETSQVTGGGNSRSGLGGASSSSFWAAETSRLRAGSSPPHREETEHRGLSAAPLSRGDISVREHCQTPEMQSHTQEPHLLKASLCCL